MNSIIEHDIIEIVSNKSLFEPLEGHTVLVTGATGLIGSLLIQSMIKYNENCTEKINVIGLARNGNKVNALFKEFLFSKHELSFCIQDIRDCIVIEADIDYIIHTASITQSKDFITYPVETIKTTVYGCENILNLGVRKKVKALIYLSSLEVYGLPFKSDNELYFNEEMFGQLNPCLIRSSYSESKRLAESMCAAYAAEFNVPVKIVRLSQTFGPGVEYNDNRVFAEFARCVIENKNIILHTTGQTIRNYCYTSDAIKGILTVLLKGNAGEAYNVANKKTTISIYDMANMVCTLSSQSIDVEIDVDDTNRGYNPMMKLALDTEKIEGLGWYPQYELNEMFERLIKSWVCN